MWGLLRQGLVSRSRFFRPYSQSSLTPSELRFKEKLEESERERQKNAPEWEKRDLSLRKRYGTWNPTRKLLRQQMNDIRDLKTRAPELKTVQIADFFNINPESIRRILKSKWVPSEEERSLQEARANKRKMESLQRKLAAKEAGAQNLKQQPPLAATAAAAAATKQKLPVLAAKPYNYKHKHKHRKQGVSLSEDPRSLRRSRKPFTQGVGDLLD